MMGGATVQMPRLGAGAPEWVFDASTGKYRNTNTGKTLSDDEVRAAVLLVIAGVKSEAASLVDSLTHRRINEAEFGDRMEGLLDALHMIASAAGTGGIPGTVEEATADLRATIAREHNYLAGFLGDLRSIFGKLAVGALTLSMLTEMQRGLALRAASYADAGLITYERQRARRMEFLDYAEAIRILHPEAEHCQGCEAEAGKGWVPIAELKPLGHEECGQWCRCTVEYRRSRVYIAPSAEGSTE